LFHIPSGNAAPDTSNWKSQSATIPTICAVQNELEIGANYVEFSHEALGVMQLCRNHPVPTEKYIDLAGENLVAKLFNWTKSWNLPLLFPK